MIQDHKGPARLPHFHGRPARLTRPGPRLAPAHEGLAPMTHRRPRRTPSAGPTPGLALALSLALSGSALAQPMSSGSGAGTGTGMSGGAPRNSTGTGRESGAGNSTGTGTESGSGLTLPGANNYISPSDSRGNLVSPDRTSGSGSVPLGPGVGTNFPGQAGALPLDSMLSTGNNSEPSTISRVHLRYARGIPSPGDRSLSLSRVASAATFSNQLALADEALVDASAAALLIPEGMVRDQRLTSIISALLYLGEAHLREGRNDMSLPDPSGTAAAIPRVDRVQLIRRTRNDGLRAADLAGRVGNPTYRAELMYRVADSMAYNSQQIVNEFPRSEGTTDRDPAGLNRSFESLPDQMLREAAALSSRIDRPVWHDRGLVTVASAAAESRQFARALSIARMIPQPEVRTDALLKIAELQARRGDPGGATSTYKEAAQAVASIPLDDPRTVLAGVLIDNLISVGRFEDARSSVALYSSEARKMIALGAIAESQGRRGASKSALAWIDREIPEAYRSQLYRRVNNGVVSAVEQNRSRDLSSRGDR